MREKLDLQMIELTDEEMTQVVGGEFFSDFDAPFIFRRPFIFRHPFLGACGFCGLGFSTPFAFDGCGACI